jgi:hydrogenase maturation protease
MLIAGVGNVLRGDDGFGVVVAQRMLDLVLPDGITVVETGIAGIALVHELQKGWDGLIVIDALDRGRSPGTVMVIEPDIIDIDGLSSAERGDVLADMHLATPDRVLMLARALGVLPDWVRIVGCQPHDAHAVHDGLSPEVTRAVDVAVTEVLRLANDRAWTGGAR